jgi:hypothetical protein
LCLTVRFFFVSRIIFSLKNTTRTFWNRFTGFGTMNITMVGLVYLVRSFSLFCSQLCCPVLGGV